MFTIQTILADTNLIIDFSQFPENSQGAAKIFEESKDGQRLDASYSRVALFRGGFFA